MQLQNERLIHKVFHLFFKKKGGKTNFQIELTAVTLSFYLHDGFKYCHWHIKKKESPDLPEQGKKHILKDLHVYINKGIDSFYVCFFFFTHIADPTIKAFRN